MRDGRSLLRDGRGLYLARRPYRRDGDCYRDDSRTYCHESTRSRYAEELVFDGRAAVLVLELHAPEAGVRCRSAMGGHIFLG